MKLKLLNQLKNAVISAPLNFEFGGLTFKFTAKIKLLTHSEVTAVTERKGAEDTDIVRELLVGWDDFVDDGKDVLFDKNTLDELLVYGGLASRLSVECINAQYRITEKN